VKESGILFELSPGVIRRFRPHVLIGFWGLFCNASGAVPPEKGTADGDAVLKSIVVPLDGSELAESVLPMVAGLAKKPRGCLVPCV
jgi:hypothetical protein